MTTRTLNIYLIPVRAGGLCLLLIGILLALSAGPAHAQCEDVAGAGDEYCETLPGAGGENGLGKGQGAGPGADRQEGLAPSTVRSLERAGAGAVSAVKSPRQDRPATPAAEGTVPSPGGSAATDGSALPYILAGLALALLLAAALIRRRRTAAEGPAG